MIFVYINNFGQGVEVIYNRHKNSCLIGEYNQNNELVLYKCEKLDIQNGIIQGGVYSGGVLFELGFLKTKEFVPRKTVVISSKEIETVFKETIKEHNKETQIKLKF